MSSLGAQSLCWFCHVAAQIMSTPKQTFQWNCIFEITKSELTDPKRLENKLTKVRVHHVDYMGRLFRVTTQHLIPATEKIHNYSDLVI